MVFSTYTLLVGLTTVSLASDVCWRDSYHQGGGRWIDTCPSGMEKSGLLCYPKCKNGYYGVGPVCWSYCPKGWRDDGALCNNRGGWTRGADNSKCPWYDVCGLTFSRGCSNCNKYPGTSNHGCTCHMWMKVTAKKTYGRGVGRPLQCGAHEYQSGLLCYPKNCRTRDNKEFSMHKTSFGFCFEKCSGLTPVDCGGACAKDVATCKQWDRDIALSGLGVAAGLAVTIFSYGAGAAMFAANTAWALSGSGGVLGLVQPMCGVDMEPYQVNAKCGAPPIATYKDIIQTECLEKCEKLDACMFAEYVAKSEACRLLRKCTPLELKGSLVYEKKPNE